MSEAQQFETSVKRAYDAHDKLLQKLFGFVPDHPSDYEVTRAQYTTIMHEVQKELGLVEGDPDFILFIFEQLSRSPRFTKEDGDDLDEHHATVGETSPSTTN